MLKMFQSELHSMIIMTATCAIMTPVWNKIRNLCSKDHLVAQHSCALSSMPSAERSVISAFLTFMIPNKIMATSETAIERCQVTMPLRSVYSSDIGYA